MIVFDDIDTFKSNQTESCHFVEQQYLTNDDLDLRTDRDCLKLIFDSSLTPTTLPTVLDLKLSRLYEEQSRLIKQRNSIFDSLIFNNKNEDLRMIDQQLDDIEAKIASFEDDSKERKILEIDLFIQNNEKRIQRYLSQLNDR